LIDKNRGVSLSTQSEGESKMDTDLKPDGKPEENGLDLLWGATPIGKAMGINPSRPIIYWNLAFCRLARLADDGAREPLRSAPAFRRASRRERGVNGRPQSEEARG
jgi:hypothetical protein